MNDESKRIWKEVFMAKSRYYLAVALRDCGIPKRALLRTRSVIYTLQPGTA
jgi:hypothetical protein